MKQQQFGLLEFLRRNHSRVILVVLVFSVVAFGVVKFLDGGFDSLMNQVSGLQDELNKNDPDYAVKLMTSGTRIKARSLNHGILNYDEGDSGPSSANSELWKSIITVKYILSGVEIDRKVDVQDRSLVGVALQIEVDNSKNLYIPVDPSDLSLFAGMELIQSDNALFKDFIKKHDLRLLSTTGVSEVENGWLFFRVPAGWVEELTLRYSRPATALAVNWTSVQVPARGFDLKLTD